MKKSIIAILAFMLTGLLTASAQEHKNTFVLSAGYSFAAFPDKITDATSGHDYQEAFHKIDITGAYEAFVWRNLFLSPQLSLWHSDNYHDYMMKLTQLSTDIQIDKDTKATQTGGTIALMTGWRVDLGKKFSLDVLTGPMLDLTFSSNVEGWGLKYHNYCRAAVFEWRAGLALNIMSHLRVGANFDLRTGSHKKYQFDSNRLYFLQSGKKNCNAINISVGYRF